MDTGHTRSSDQQEGNHLPLDSSGRERGSQVSASTGGGESSRLRTCTLAGGCFWCTEAVFKRLKGVQSVIPGYAASQVVNPSYQQVCSGRTGAAEAIQITYDPSIISYATLLDIFWHVHDPTTLNRQGNDVGTQYRSAVYYQNDEEKQTILASKEALEKSGVYKDPVVTEIVPFTNFYSAEAYHEDYYENHRSAPYCMVVIDPKVKKLLKTYGNAVKEEYQK